MREFWAARAMSEPDHVQLLQQGVGAWNAWRAAQPYLLGVKPDLRGWDGSWCRQFDFPRFIRQYVAHPSEMRELELAYREGTLDDDLVPYGWHFLDGIDLTQTDLTGADLSRLTIRHARLCSATLVDTRAEQATLDWSDLRDARLDGANLRGARLVDVALAGASLKGACLTGAALVRCSLADADLSGADLRGANLTGSALVNTNLEGADLTGARIYGLSVWDVNTTGAAVRDLVITRHGDPPITVDNLDVAQFIYLLLNNRNIRGAVDSISTKVVLILGRFTEPRKAVLETIRSEVRRRGYLPVLFDFEAPGGRDLTETISLLAHLARFIVADLTDARSLPQELQRIVPDLPSVWVQPIVQAGAEVYAMFEHLQRYPWVLPIEEYPLSGMTDVTTAALLQRLERSLRLSSTPS